MQRTRPGLPTRKVTALPLARQERVERRIDNQMPPTNLKSGRGHRSNPPEHSLQQPAKRLNRGYSSPPPPSRAAASTRAWEIPESKHTAGSPRDRRRTSGASSGSSTGASTRAARLARPRPLSAQRIHETTLASGNESEDHSQVRRPQSGWRVRRVDGRVPKVQTTRNGPRCPSSQNRRPERMMSRVSIEAGESAD